MTIRCPKDDVHKRFGTTAHVAQDWIVNDRGAFLEVTDNCSQVTHAPDAQDLFTCAECGAEAIVIP